MFIKFFNNLQNLTHILIKMPWLLLTDDFSIDTLVILYMLYVHVCLRKKSIDNH